MSTSRRRFIAGSASFAAGVALRGPVASADMSGVARMPASGSDAAFMPPVIPAATAASNPGPTLGAGPVPAGILRAVADVGPGGTLSGKGIGVTILDAFGLRPANRKAIVVIEGPGGGTVANMTLRGAAICKADGQNASGVCNGQLGFDMVIDGVEIYGCQEGIRSLGGNVTIKNCHVHHNGADSQSTGDTHNAYLNDASGKNGSDRSIVTMTDSVFEKSLLAHEFKSRLGFHVVTGCTFASLVIPGSAGNYETGPTTQLGGNGSCTDICNGGDWKGVRNTYVKGPGVFDLNFITVGAEGLYPGYTGRYHEESPVFDNRTGKQCYLVAGGGCTLTLNNPTFKGGRPVPRGNVVITGTITEL